MSLPPPAPRAGLFGVVGRLGMDRPRIEAAGDLEPRRIDPREEVRSGPQAQVFGEIGQDQPPFAARCEVRRQPGQETGAACAALRRRCRVRSESSGARAPTADCRRPAPRDRPGSRSACTTSTRCASPRRSRSSARAHASARGSTSVATTRATPRRASTAAMTPVPVPTSNAVRPDDIAAGSGAPATRSMYSWRIGRTRQVRVDPAAGCRGDLDALARHSCAPISPRSSRSDTTPGSSCWSPGFRAGLAHVGCATQRDAVIRVDRNEQHAAACVRAATAPGGGGGTRRPAPTVPRPRPASRNRVSGGRRGSRARSATGGRSGSRRGRGARCPGRRGRTPRRRSCGRRRAPRAGRRRGALRAPARRASWLAVLGPPDDGMRFGLSFPRSRVRPRGLDRAPV